MKFQTFLLTIVLAASLPAAVMNAAATDIPGSADHPLIGRFKGAEINAYDVKDFDEYEMITGPVKGKNVQSSEKLEGKMYRIAYKTNPGHSLTEITRNYRLGLEKAGFDIVFECDAKACGQRDFVYRTETLPIPKMSVDSWNYRYLAAKKSDKSGVVAATVLTSLDSRKAARIQVFVVEAKAMAFKMVDAKQMAGDIADKGRVALYGIYFDTDKASIKPESEPTLIEIAGFLKANPKLTIIVVGHTDNQGELDYNRSLSERRARAVVAALEAGHGITKGRLAAAGVGFLAPVASNASEAGRALNRRVELIEK